MKANELQIGDWVQSKAYNGKILYTQIVALDNRDGEKHIISSNRWVEDYKFEPIPLTSEILEKNGFVIDGCIIDEDGYRCNSYKLNDSQVWGYLAKDGFDIAFSGYNQPNNIILKYVHELQHAIRLCRLNELADNFKI